MTSAFFSKAKQGLNFAGDTGMAAVSGLSQSNISKSIWGLFKNDAPAANT